MLILYRVYRDWLDLVSGVQAVLLLWLLADPRGDGDSFSKQDWPREESVQDNGRGAQKEQAWHIGDTKAFRNTDAMREVSNLVQSGRPKGPWVQTYRIPLQDRVSWV